MKEKLQQILELVDEYIQERNRKLKWIAGKDWIPYSGPYFDSKEYRRAIETLLKGWMVLGSEAMEFEKTFPKLLGKKYGIVTNSGSSANLLMMLAAKKRYGLKKYDKVIVPVAGFPTTLNPILQAELTPVFVDIELDTLNMNFGQFDDAIGRGAKSVVLAPALGNPPEMDLIQDMAANRNLIVLVDCCDALGSAYSGKPLGSFGKIATCSFYPAHHITMGEGGFLATDDEEVEKIARSLREWGRGCYCVGRKANLSTKGSCGCRFDRWLPSMPDEIFDHKYIYDNIGYNLKPIELQCSIGLEQMKKLTEFHIRRTQNHQRLTNIFSPYKKFFHFHQALEWSSVSWFAFPITVRDDAPFKRSQFTTFLEKHKIQTRNYFGGNLLLQPAYQEVAWENKDGYPHIGGVVAQKQFPVATKVMRDTLFLGTSPIITDEQLDYIEEKINQFMKTYGGN